MRTLIVTPLFPPDISLSAKYTKELAVRLSSSDEVTVLHFGKLPEQVQGVSFISISKKLLLLPRIWNMFWAIAAQAKKADVVLLQNGPSVELPALLASFLIKRKIIYIISDSVAKQKISASLSQKIICSTLQKRALGEITIENTNDLITPIKHPLVETDPSSVQRLENNWKKHLETIQSISNV